MMNAVFKGVPVIAPSSGWSPATLLQLGYESEDASVAPARAQPPNGVGPAGHCVRAVVAGGVSLFVASRRCIPRRPGSGGNKWRYEPCRGSKRVALAALSAAEGPVVLIASAAIGVCTGGAIVVFEEIIHALEHFREELPIPMVAPLLGAAILACIFTVMGQDGLKGTDIKSLKSYLKPKGPPPPENWPVRGALNAASAAVTLGFGNSLGPEAPAATLGANFAFAVSRALGFFDTPQETLRKSNSDGRAPGAEQRALIDKALQGSKVVDALEKDELDLLMTAFTEVKVKAGETLIRQGDDVEDDEPGLFVTDEGQLDVYVKTDKEDHDDENGKKVFTYEKDGMLIGELAVLFRGPRAATVVAATDCILWSVDRASFEAAGGRSAGAVRSLALNSDSILASGAAAGVAAGFNAPIAGIFFATEVVKPSGENSLDLTTRLLAAALSAAVCTSFTGGGPGVITSPDFAWTGGNPELVLFLIMGALIGCVAYASRRMAGVARELIATLKGFGAPQVLLPFVGSIVTILFALLCDGRVMFDGFGVVNEVLKDAALPLKDGVSNWSLDPLTTPREEFNGAEFGIMTSAALLSLLVLKLVATSVCQASGLIGGTFAPALLMGACVGGCVGRSVALLKGVLTVSNVATYVVVGMASQLAANCAVPITSVVLAVELVGGASYKAVLPLICSIGVAVYFSSVLLPALLEGLDRKAAIKAVERYAEDTGL